MKKIMVRQLFTQEAMEEIEAKKQFESKHTIHFVGFKIATYTSVAILWIELLFVEINLMPIWLNMLLLGLPTLIFGLNSLVYFFPLLNNRLNYCFIIKEQTKPTTAIYKLRKVFLVTFFTIGIVIAIGNIVLFIVEIFR